MTSIARPNAKRRWRVFSIRTLLVVITALCVWLSWHVSIARERIAMQAFVNEHRGRFTSAEPNAPSKISWVRRMSGDNEAREITFFPFEMSEEDEANVKATFPEAEFWQHCVCCSMPVRRVGRRELEERRELLRRARRALGIERTSK